MRSDVKLSESQFTNGSLRIIAAAALVARLVFAPAVAVAAGEDTHVDRAELPGKELHAKLNAEEAVLELNTEIRDTLVKSVRPEPVEGLVNQV